MLPMSLIRERPDEVRTMMVNRGDDPSLIDQVLDLDARRRALLGEEESLRATRKRGSARPSGGPPDEAAREEMRALGGRIEEFARERAAVEAQLQDLMLRVPNMPDPRVPIGHSEEENVLVRTWGEPRQFDFQPLPHWELGERLGIIDLAAAARLSGARFSLLKGAGAALERALIAFMLDIHTREHGYTEVAPPYLVRSDVLVGSGQLPRFADTMYRDAEEDLWLIPTAEVPLVNLHRQSILEPGSLPASYVAATPCFRRERVAAGRDVRGIKRIHQFQKVEMVKLVEPEASDEALERLVGDAEDIFRRLQIPHQVLLLCTAELSSSMRRTYDINVWAPGSGEWQEASSVSNAGDYQARRADVRFRRVLGGPVQFAHTLNGSGVAIPRTLIAVLESNQQADGSVLIPNVLRPYMGGLERIQQPDQAR
jgi:seryl-tRNA synthetase